MQEEIDDKRKTVITIPEPASSEISIYSDLGLGLALERAHENLITVSPDGSWGWMIVFVSFYAYLVIEVPVFGFQVVLPHLVKLFGLKATHVSLIFSTYTMAMFLLGPLAGGICNRFGFRITTILGSLFMIIGIGALYFVNSFISFVTLYGAIAGSGTSFILMVATVAPSFWFESKRSIATAITSSASGVSVITVMLTSYVSNTCGWRWCFVLWAGSIVILCAGSLLLYSPPMVELESDVPLVPEYGRGIVDIVRIDSIRPIKYSIPRAKYLVDKKLEKISHGTGISVLSLEQRPSAVGEHARMGCKQHVGSRPIYRKDIFYEGDVPYVAKEEGMAIEEYTLTASSLPTVKDIQQEVEGLCNISEAFTKALSKMIDFSLFRSPTFLLILVSSMFVYTARYVPFLVIKRVNIGHMEERMANRLVPMMGFGSVISRVGIGLILYHFHYFSSISAAIGVAILGGIVLCIIPISNWFPYQLVLSLFGGVLPSVVVSLRSIIIIDLIGLDKLTSSTGILFFVQGFASFAGLPIAELLVEVTGRQYAALLFSGGAYIISGLFLVIVFFLNGRKMSTESGVPSVGA